MRVSSFLGKMVGACVALPFIGPVWFRAALGLPTMAPICRLLEARSSATVLLQGGSGAMRFWVDESYSGIPSGTAPHRSGLPGSTKSLRPAACLHSHGTRLQVAIQLRLLTVLANRDLGPDSPCAQLPKGLVLLQLTLPAWPCIA